MAVPTVSRFRERDDYPIILGVRADTWAGWLLFAAMAGLVAWWRLT